MTSTTKGPLHGLRILEVCHMLAGPYCGMLLADLGAEVIKIESGEGDIARSIGHHTVGGHNVYFASLNRNKKSALLDLTSGKDRETFRQLVATSHGLVTNLRPSAIKKLGLTYDKLKAYNPNIACLALTGFGLEGPYSKYPAYDYTIQAMAGVLMLTGEPNGPPSRAGYSVVDNTSGMMAAIGLLSKLVEGRGGQVEVALYDMMLSQLNYLAAAYLNTGEEPVRLPMGGHSFFVPAQIFPTTDGYITIFITHDRFWRSFAEVMNRPEWLVDERFATTVGRSENREIVVDAIAAELRKKTSEEWVVLLQSVGLVVASVSTLADALDDPRTRRMIVNVATPSGPLRLMGNSIKIDGFEEQYTAPPSLGEHTVSYRAEAMEALGKP